MFDLQTKLLNWLKHQSTQFADGFKNVKMTKKKLYSMIKDVNVRITKNISNFKK
jgi:hypothetical protein